MMDELINEQAFGGMESLNLISLGAPTKYTRLWYLIADCVVRLPSFADCEWTGGQRLKGSVG